MSVWSYWADKLFAETTTGQVVTTTSQAACDTLALSAVNGLKQQTSQIEAAWKVKELYYVQDFEAIFRHVVTTTTGALDTGMKVVAASGDSIDVTGLKTAIAALALVAKDEVSKFTEGYQIAKATGAKAIRAPDFKAWALRMLRLSVDVQWWSQYTQCRAQFTSIASLVSAGWSALKGGLQKVLDIVVAVVEAVVDTVKAIVNIPSHIGQMLTVLKWGVIVGATGFVVYKTKAIPKLQAAYARRRAARLP